MRRKRFLKLALLCCCMILAYFVAVNGPLAGTPRALIWFNAHPEAVRYDLPPALVLGGKTWVQRARSSYQRPVDLTMEDMEGYVYVQLASYEWPELNGESNCLSRGTPYAHWSSEEFPEAIVAYVGKQRMHPGVDQWLGEWAIFTPSEEPPQSA